MDKIFSIAPLIDKSFLNISIKNCTLRRYSFFYVIPLRFERKTHAFRRALLYPAELRTILNCECKGTVFIEITKRIRNFFALTIYFFFYSASKQKVNSNKYGKRKTLYMTLFQPIPPNSYTSMKKRTETIKKKRRKVIGKTRKETGHTFYYILIIPKTSRCITESHTRQSHTKRNEIINPFLKRRVRERSRHATQHSPWGKSGANIIMI